MNTHVGEVIRAQQSCRNFVPLYLALQGLLEYFLPTSGSMDTKKCTECKATKPLLAFLKRKTDASDEEIDQYSAICGPCRQLSTERQRARRKRKRAEEGTASNRTGAGVSGGTAENSGAEEDSAGVRMEGFSHNHPISLEDLLGRLRTAEKLPLHLQRWKVDLGGEAPPPQDSSLAERAHHLSVTIGDAMLLRWK